MATAHLVCSGLDVLTLGACFRRVLCPADQGTSWKSQTVEGHWKSRISSNIHRGMRMHAYEHVPAPQEKCGGCWRVHAGGGNAVVFGSGRIAGGACGVRQCRSRIWQARAGYLGEVGKPDRKLFMRDTFLADDDTSRLPVTATLA